MTKQSGGAVAWRHVYFRDGKRIGIGPWRGIGERINEQQGDDIEYAYTTPPATVPADAVLALAAKWRERAAREDEDGERYESDGSATRLNLCADELESLTRGEK